MSKSESSSSSSSGNGNGVSLKNEVAQHGEDIAVLQTNEKNVTKQLKRFDAALIRIEEKIDSKFETVMQAIITNGRKGP